MAALKILNDRYQLLSIIKRGGFGTIYKGYDSVLGKEIAVKEINQNLVADKWYIDQFRNEARHVAKMNHQNIVHIFDLVQTLDGLFYIVMEYIDGFDLNSFVKESKTSGRPIPQHLAVHIIAEVCKALDYAHNCRNTDSNEPLNLVHQDISPGNIMIAKSGAVKLIDFGIAGVQKEPAGDADTITLQGKIQYMSPEHVAAEQVLDKRSDIFSLGLVLFELLEGKRFFQSSDTRQIIETLHNGKIKLKGFSKTSKPLQKVLGKAIEKSPEKRYQNANQFYIDLVTYLVMNNDSVSIDTELTEYIQLLNRKDAEFESFVDSMDLSESDLFTKVAPDEVQEKQESKNGGLMPADAVKTTPEPTKKEVSPNQAAPVMPAQPAGGNNLKEQRPGPQIPVEYFDAGDEIKTVIDVVRLSTRGHKKLVIRSAMAAVFFIFLFVLLDVMLQWTGFGGGIYDYLFPPTIKIESIPAGAQVYLNGELVPGKTPLAIDKIDPGVYELKLALAPFKPIIKSMHIPGKGQAQVKGERIRRGDKPYTFRFRTTLQIESIPPGAEIFINGIKFGQNTPCAVTWEVGEHCEIELKKTGFSDLTGFALDEQMLEEIEDRRLWYYYVETKPELKHRIRGLFGKYFSINSRPSNAAIYLDENPQPIGYTGRKQAFFLFVSRHKIVLKKKGYNSRTLNINVNENSASKIFGTLTRPVRFVAYDDASNRNQDLRATLTKLTRGGKVVSSGRKTPFSINLQPQIYYAVFSKPGYEEVRVKVTSSSKLVTARLRPSTGRFSIVVLDSKTHRPLSNVEVRYQSMDKRNGNREMLDVTDVEGTVNGMLQPGIYLFRTSKNGYKYQEQSVAIEAANISLLEFNLAKR